jgi:hypothetical protein
MPNRGAPKLSPYDRSVLKLVQQGLGNGMDPGLAGQEIDSILQGAQARVANRQAQMAPLTDALLQQAAAGAPVGAASALTNAYSAIHPGVAGPQAQQRLGAFQSALYPEQGQASPLYQPAPGEAATPIDAESLAAIAQDVQAWASGAVKQPSGLPMGLHEAVMTVITPLRIQGYDEAQLDQIRQYVEQQWQTYGGPTPPTPAA